MENVSERIDSHEEFRMHNNSALSGAGKPILNMRMTQEVVDSPPQRTIRMPSVNHGNHTKVVVAPVTINVPQKNFTFEAISNPSPQQKSPGNNVHKKVVNLNTHQIMGAKDRSPHVSGNHIKLQQVQVPKKPQIRHSPQSLKQGPVTNRITLNRVNPGQVVINSKKKSSTPHKDFTIQDLDGTQVQDEEISKSEEKVMSPKQQEMARPEGLVHVSSNREIVILKDRERLQDSIMRGDEKSAGTTSPHRGGRHTVKFQGIKNLNDTAR